MGTPKKCMTQEETRKTLKKRERRKKKSNNNNKYFFTFTYRKIIFCQKAHSEKLTFSLYCYICIRVFFAQQIIGNAVIKLQRTYRYAVTCRRRTLTQNTCQQTRYFNVAMNCYYFFDIFQRSTFNSNFLIHLIEVTESPYFGIVFQSIYISKICS